MAIAPVRLRIEGQDKTGAAFASVQGRLGSLRSQIGTVAPLLATAFGARAIKQQLDYADTLTKTARQLGGTVEFLSEAAFAGKLYGVETETLNKALLKTQVVISESLTGNREYARTLAALGLEAEALKKVSLDEQFSQILRGLKGVTSETDRAALAVRLFGARGAAIARMAGNFDDARIAAREAGATITQAFGESAEVLNDRMTTAIERMNSGLRFAIVNVLEFSEGLAKAAAGLITGASGDSFVEQMIVQLQKAERRAAGLNTQLAAIAADKPGARPLALIAEIQQAEKFVKDTQAALDEISLGGIATQIADDFNARVKAAFSIENLDVGAILNEVDRQVAKKPKVADDDKNRVHGLFAVQIERGFDDLLGTLGQVDDVAGKVLADLDDEGTETAESLEDSFRRWAHSGEISLERLGATAKEVFRQMAIDAAITTLFQVVGTAFGFGGGRASGGPVAAGTAYVVGEQGPEMFVPGSSGRIIPNGAGGASVTVVNNVDARGTDPAIIASLPKILEDNNERVRSDIVRLFRQGRVV